MVTILFYGCIALAIVAMLYRHFGWYRIRVMHLNRDKFYTILTMLPLVCLWLWLLLINIFTIIVNKESSIKVGLLVVTTSILVYYVFKYHSDIRWYYKQIMKLKG